jgi:hypothetical protein
LQGVSDGNLQASSRTGETTVIHTVSQTLQSMGVEQYLMAFLFLGCYCMSLSQFIGTRGRRWAVAGAGTATIAFVALCDPWENGVLVVAFTLVSMGGFAAAVWLLWALFGWPDAAPSVLPDTDLHVEEAHAPAPPRDWAGPPVIAALVGMRRHLKPLGLGQAR